MHQFFLRKSNGILFIRHAPHLKGKLKQLSCVAQLALGELKKATPPPLLTLSNNYTE